MSGRIRTIKPELLEDERVASLSHEAWRMYVSLFLLSDDYGNSRAAHRYLGGAVFWAREPLASVPEILRELLEAQLVVLYEVRGQAYLHVRGWDKHQRVDKPSKPRVPGPKDAEAKLVHGTLAASSRDSRESLAPDHDHDHDHDPRSGSVRASARPGSAESDTSGDVACTSLGLLAPDSKPLASGSEQGSPGDAKVNPGPTSREQSASARRPADPLGDQTLASAWSLGVREGLGRIVSEPKGRGEIQKLVAAVDAHGPQPTGDGSFQLDARVKWVDATAREWARTKPQRVNVYAFVDWLDGGRAAPSATWRATEIKQAADPNSPWRTDENYGAV